GRDGNLALARSRDPASSRYRLVGPPRTRRQSRDDLALLPPDPGWPLDPERSHPFRCRRSKGRSIYDRSSSHAPDGADQLSLVPHRCARTVAMNALDLGGVFVAPAPPALGDIGAVMTGVGTILLAGATVAL